MVVQRRWPGTFVWCSRVVAEAKAAAARTTAQGCPVADAYAPTLCFGSQNISRAQVTNILNRQFGPSRGVAQWELGFPDAERLKKRRRRGTIRSEVRGCRSKVSRMSHTKGHDL
jgi:hypothetical protein